MQDNSLNLGEDGRLAMTGGREKSPDWSRTPLGPEPSWPQPVRTLVELMRASTQPMFIVWGPERILLYNDPYGVVLADKHPGALGRDFLDVWHEIRADLEPIVAEAYAGRSVHMDDITLVMHRRGYPEETHFAFSYTPVRDEAGEVGGFFCACVETTTRIASERSRADELAHQARLFENAPGFIAVVKEPDHRFELANRAYRRLIGGRECVGRTVREVLPELIDQPFFDLLDKVYATGERHVSSDTRILLGSGPLEQRDERFLDFIYEPIRDEAGRVGGVFVEGHDVTEAHRDRDALREREEQLRLIVDGARDYAILTMDPERHITSWSAGAEAAFRLTEAEAVGRLVDELFTPEDVAAGRPELEAGTAAEQGCATDRRWHVRRDGSRVFIDGSTHVLPPDERGRPRGFLKIGRDETDRHRRDEELARTRVELVESEGRFRTLAEAAPALIFSGHRERGNDWVNRRYRDYTGRSADELLGGRWREVVHPDDLAEHVEWVAKAGAAGEPFEGRIRIRRHDGVYRWHLCRGEPLRDPETGDMAQALGVCFDIDDQVRAEDALKVGEEQLRELNETLERRVLEEVSERARAEDALRQSQKMEAIGQLTGGVAHDFNNLLTIIRSSADLLRRRELTEEKRRRYVDAISDTADRAAKLTGQLLAFARRQALRPEVFDAAARVDDIADMLRTVLGARVELVIEGRCRPCPVEADTGQFETALVNMAVNARDAMDGEGRLTIMIEESNELPAVRGHAGSPGSFVAVSVTDTGTGIAPDVLQHIFEPFFTTKEVGRGTGLGLSQVFGFAKQSGGEVAVESEAGQGTTFRLFLPRVDAVFADEAEEGPDALPYGRGRVLVVEDNAAVGEFATQLLEDVGYTTVLAGNAAEALSALEAPGNEFDLVFSDVVMPGMGGVELGRIVRERWPGLPVVLTSGYSHVLASDARHGFPVLHKPYSVEELARVLRQASWGRRRATHVER